MRERVRHGEVGRGYDENAVRGVPRLGRRRGAGPRPVRPGVAPVAVRPPEVPRPGGATGRPVAEPRWGAQVGPRLLARRRSGSVARGPRYRLRRAVAVFALVAASGTAVVALGLLARLAAPVPSAADAASTAVVVTVAPGETVWEVVDRVAPGSSGERRAALAQRIVVDNALGSVRPQPGRVLRVAPV